MENKSTAELIEKAKQAKSVEELTALAKENGFELTEDEAKNYFEKLNASGALSDEELDNVSGGGCYYKDGRLVVTCNYSCGRYKCRSCGKGMEDTIGAYHSCVATGDRNHMSACKNCAYKTNKGARMLCNHPLNYKR